MRSLSVMWIEQPGEGRRGGGGCEHKYESREEELSFNRYGKCCVVSYARRYDTQDGLQTLRVEI